MNICQCCKELFLSGVLIVNLQFHFRIFSLSFCIFAVSVRRIAVFLKVAHQMGLYNSHRVLNAYREIKFFASFGFPEILKSIFQVIHYQFQLLQETHSHLH